MIKNELKTPTLRFSDFTSDWENKKLGDVCDIFRGGSPRPIEKFITTGKGVNWLKIGDVPLDGKYVNQTKEKIINEGVIKSRTVNIGDFILSNSMSFGRPYIMNINACIHDGWLALSQYSNNFYKEFLYYSISSKYIYKQFSSMASGSGVKNLNKNSVSKIKIKIPSMEEQNKIAGFLSSVDKRIDLLQQKHDTFIQYKNALMQGLFPRKGQTNPIMRLNDKNNNPFTKNWENKKLGDVAKFSKGQGLSKNDIIENGKNDCILYGELYTKYYENINTVYSKTNIESNSCSKVGDLLFPASTTTNATDLATASVVNKDNILLSGDINIVRLNLEEYSPLCLSYMVRSSLKKNIARLGQGITIVHLYNSHLKTICFKSPELEEQNKIAGFLSSVDKKIENISNQLNQSKQFKKSLMQKMFI